MSIVLVGGPTGVGKTSIIDCLLNAEGSFCRPKAYTTRPKRVDDISGQFLHISADSLLELSDSGELLSLHNVHGYQYGLSRRSVVEIEDSGKIAIKEFFLRDHESIRSKVSRTISVAILPTDKDVYEEHIIRHGISGNRNREDLMNELEDHIDIINSNTSDIVVYNDFLTSIKHLSEELARRILSQILRDLVQ